MKAKRICASVVVVHLIFFPSNNLIHYKTPVSIGGKENSLVTACLFHRESYRHAALLLNVVPSSQGDAQGNSSAGKDSSVI